MFGRICSKENEAFYYLKLQAFGSKPIIECLKKDNGTEYTLNEFD